MLCHGLLFRVAVAAMRKGLWGRCVADADRPTLLNFCVAQRRKWLLEMPALRDCLDTVSVWMSRHRAALWTGALVTGSVLGVLTANALYVVSMCVRALARSFSCLLTRARSAI